MIPFKTTNSTQYRWDANNRLIDICTGRTAAQAAATAPQVSYAYDASGNRIKKSVNSAASPGQTSATSYLIDTNHSYAQVALESTANTPSGGTGAATVNSTAYVWGAGLIRQTRVSAASGVVTNVFGSTQASEDLFPLSGHLGTSLGAVDASGNVAGYSQFDSFGSNEYAGQLPNSAPNLNHQYTGEYFDADSQLTYLRARWYDAKMGRFISADPFEGRQQDPRSLNRYAYAHGDPVHGRDPTGRETMGGLMAGMGAMAVLSVVAISSFNSVLMSRPLAPGQTSRPFSLIDAIAIAQFRSKSQDREAVTTAPAVRSDPGHHTIPVYLCGGLGQVTSQITPAQHTAIHAGLSGVYVMKRLSEEYATKIVFGRHRSEDIVLDIATTVPGRGAIANAIYWFYTDGGWLDEGRPLNNGTVFAGEREPYVSGVKTSLPWCSRSGNP